MKKFKMVMDGYILAITTRCGQIRISDEEYRSILSLIRSKPADPAGYEYKLKDGTLEWELVELPPEPAPDPDENI